MAGHSKWAQIKRQKAVEDIKKSRLFGLLAQEITAAVKRAGDKQAAGVRAAIKKARDANMPLGVIERAVERGLQTNARSEEVIYEAYGPGGSALLIIGQTDNKNRINQEIKHKLSEAGISLSAPGSVLWAFERQLDKTYRPRQFKTLASEQISELKKIIASLSENPDVRAVFTNVSL